MYERHLPETVVIGVANPLEIGDHVRPKQAADVDEDFRVISMNSRTATVVSLKSGEESKAPVRDLLPIKRFGDPAYAGLVSVGEIRHPAAVQVSAGQRLGKNLMLQDLSESRSPALAGLFQ